MTANTIAFLVTMGILGGALNSMAAGGGVLTFLSLLAVGLPPQVAVATSQVAIPASFAPSVVRAWKDRAAYRPMVPGLIAGAAGTGLGVWLVSRLDGPTFRVLTPILMCMAAALLLVQPRMQTVINSRKTDARGRHLAVALALFLCGIYAGAFGGAVAVAILVAFAIITPWPWHTANHYKNGACLIMSLVCSPAFIVTGLASWEHTAWLAGSLLVGGIGGTWLASRLPANFLRKMVAVVTFGGAAVMVGG